MTSKLVSTKKLTVPQRELVLNAGLSIVDYDILEISQVHHDYTFIQDNQIIITSKNALPALDHLVSKPLKIFCVGKQTASLLADKGLTLELVADNAQELAQQIIARGYRGKFTYLCGNYRRNELARVLQEQNLTLKEVIVYNSSIVIKSFDRIFAAGLFYSPRGVDAFAKANKYLPHRAICIGQTTAQAAREHYDEVIVANKQTVENVLVTAIKELRDD